MQFTTSLLVSSLLASACALPQLNKRDGGIPNITSIHPTDDWCISAPATDHTRWGFYVHGDQMPSAGGKGSYGGGFLDNIMPQGDKCKPINWQAVLDTNSPTGVAATFSTPVDCQVYDIAQALQKANKDHRPFYCSGDTLETLIVKEKQDQQEAIQEQDRQFNHFIQAMGAVSNLGEGAAKIAGAAAA